MQPDHNAVPLDFEPITHRVGKPEFIPIRSAKYHAELTLETTIQTLGTPKSDILNALFKQRILISHQAWKDGPRL